MRGAWRRRRGLECLPLPQGRWGLEMQVGSESLIGPRPRGVLVGDLGGDSDNDPSRSESVVRVEGACTDTKSLQRGYGQGVSIILAK